MNSIEVAWLAGILEGEGCFTANPRGVRISMSCTDQDVIQRVADLIGCKVYQYRRGNQGGAIGFSKKPSWQIMVCKKSTIRRTLEAILPHMGERRSAKIQECLSLLSRPEDKRPHDPITGQFSKKS